MKPRLVVFTSTFPRWENDTDPPFVFELCKRLVDRYEVHVVAPHYPGSKTNETLSGVHVVRFRYFFSKYEKLAGSVGILPTLKNNKLYYAIVPFFLGAGLFSLLRCCTSIKPNIVHSHWIIPQGFIVYIIHKLTQIPYIVTAHGADVFGLTGSLFKNLRKAVLNNASIVTAVSIALKSKLRSEVKSSTNIEVVSMGVDSKKFSPSSQECIDNNHVRLLYVGRLTEKKGVSYLIDAIPKIVNAFPAARLTIIGSGELEGQLKKQVKDLDISDFVTFRGAVPNHTLPEVYRENSIFIGPSIEAQSGDTEGFGLTFVEAAMSGCLLIGTDVGGIKDIIINNKTGFLVNPKDSEGIAEKIQYAIQNPSEVEDLTKNARALCVEQYDWEVVCDKYSSLYSEIIKVRSGQGA